MIYLKPTWLLLCFSLTHIPTTNFHPKSTCLTFPPLETTHTTQERITTPNNATAVAWDTLAHPQLTMDTTTASLTRQYCDACKWTICLADSFCKWELPFLSPQLRQQMHQYNFKHGDTPKLPSTDPPDRPPSHWYPRQQHQHPFPTRNPTTVPTPQPYNNKLGSTPDVPSSTFRQDNLQDLLSEFYNLGKN